MKRLKRCGVVLCAAVVLFVFSDSSASGVIRYAVFSAPPFMIHPDGASGQISGIDVEIVRELAKRSGYDVEIISASWVRCLDLIKTGRADLITSVYRCPEREQAMVFFDNYYLPYLPISFYSRKGSGKKIQRYEDLYSAGTIGVLRGALYFNRFDDDSRLSKYEVTSQDMLFPMLVAGRIDLMAGYVPTENYRIFVEGFKGKVEKSPFEYRGGSAVYFALSQKSPLVKDFKRLNAIFNQMKKDGTVSAIITKYYSLK